MDVVNDQDLESISLLMFSNQNDYEEYAPEMLIDIPFAKMHRLFVYRIGEELRMEEYNVNFVQFNKVHYTEWLKRNRKVHGSLARAEWVSIYKEALD